MAGRSMDVVFYLLEITLISAQDLKPPSNPAGNQRRMRTYAVVWVDPSTKLRTLVDRVGGENPTWNEKFIFRVPEGILADSSSSAVHVEIYAVGLLVDSLVGAVRLLVGNQRLLSKPRGEPSFTAVGIRRPSGRFHGVLNIGSAVLSLRHVSALAVDALERGGGEGICYRVLMNEDPKIRRQSSARKREGSAQASPLVLRERNAERESAEGEKGKEARWAGAADGAGHLCGLGFHRRNLPDTDENSNPI